MAIVKEDIIKLKEQFNTELTMALKDRASAEEIKKLLDSLESNGFYTAPATTKYFCSFEGGLLLHSLNTYHILKNLVQNFNLDYGEDTLAIVGLLHCISKSVLYELGTQNKKFYSDTGSKKDNKGRFDWITVDAYLVKDVKDRNTFGNEALNSFIYVNSYLKLKPIEIAAILNYQLELGTGNVNKDMFSILDKYDLVTLLHCASLLASYVLEQK